MDYKAAAGRLAFYLENWCNPDSKMTFNGKVYSVQEIMENLEGTTKLGKEIVRYCSTAWSANPSDSGRRPSAR